MREIRVTHIFVFYALISYNPVLPQIQEAVPDVTLIYIVNPSEAETFLVDGEIHVGSNSIGKGFILDGTIIAPENALQTNNFQCIHSDNGTPCKWTAHGEWVSEEMTAEDLKALSVTKPSACNNRKGCQGYCVNHREGVECDCPPPFQLNRDGKTCSTNTGNMYLLNQDKGQIESPNYPYGYPQDSDVTWIIVAPNKLIRLKIDTLETEPSYDFLRVSGGQQTESYSGSHSNTSTYAENEMILQFHSDNGVSGRGFSASYETEPRIHTMPTILRSAHNDASLVLPLDIVPENLCLLVVYKLHSLAFLEIFLESLSSKYNMLSLNLLYEINGWQIGQFTAPSELNTNGEPANLNVHCVDGQCKIFRITECTSNGDVYSMGRMNWTSKEFPKLWKDVTEEDFANCSNGGVYHSSSNLCVCPPGFTGNKCEEACGPNRFGSNCTGVCSFFERRCKNMIFCNPLDICMCATGFTGVRCEKECDDGYGPNCKFDCGECIDGICNKFTGVCEAGCRDGYYPPLCHERYVSMTEAPVIVKESWNYVLLRIDPRSIQGKGTPYLYSIQFKEKGSDVWEKTTPQIFEPKSFVANLTGLKVGRKYVSRVVIISDDGNFYQDSDIPETEFITFCQVPNSDDYQVKSRDVSSYSFTVEFKYDVVNETWCPVHSFEITLQTGWRKFSKISSKSELVVTYTDLLPGRTYAISICALTLHGKSTCSVPFKITTLEEAPGKVQFLSVESISARSALISWKRPLFSGGIVKGYKIHYQCIKDFSCDSLCEYSNGTIETTKLSAIIDGLIPFSQYKIKVAAFTTNPGPFTCRFIMTHSAKPENVPTASKMPLISRSNSTASIQWEPPNCLGSNGISAGYFVSLSTSGENGSASDTIFSGATMDKKTTFTGLVPSTRYEMHVFTVNTHGWNPKYPLKIMFSTSGTVPDAVADLEVYKSGRRMLGIRWKKPLRTYGELKYFTVTYHQIDRGQVFNETILPTPCKSWGDHYCHTINSHLQPRKNYLVSVRARNDIIDEDGIESEITAKTAEFAPEPPSYVRIMETEDRSFEIKWGIPRKFNGELRTFLVNVEHTDAANDEDCCENFPVQELPVTEESLEYSMKIDGLLPTSTYIISVSAKTVSLGPNINITFNTAPSPVTSLMPPQIIKLSEKSYSVKITQPPNIMHPRLKSMFLLLVLSQHQNITSKIWRNDISRKIVKEVNHSFYITSEIDLAEGQSEQIIEIGTGKNIQNGTIGELQDPELIPGEYQIGLILLQTFGDATSVSSQVSDTFQVSE